MNFLRRLFLFLVGLCLVAAGILLLACTANTSIANYWASMLERLLYGGIFRLYPLLIMAALIILGVICLYISLHRKAPDRLVKVSDNQEGSVNISLPAIETIVKQASTQIKSIKETKVQLKNTPEGAAVYLHVTVPAGTNIPETASALQKEVKEKLELLSGVNVAEVKVLIENIIPAGTSSYQSPLNTPAVPVDANTQNNSDTSDTQVRGDMK